MPNISLKDVLVSAILAAIIGSTIGSALLLFNELLDFPLQKAFGRNRFPVNVSLLEQLITFPMVWGLSLVGTVPAALIIGVPAIYPFRNLIGHHPFLAALPVMIYGMILGTLSLGWMVSSNAASGRDFSSIWLYSGACALGFVLSLQRIVRIELTPTPISGTTG